MILLFVLICVNFITSLQGKLNIVRSNSFSSNKVSNGDYAFFRQLRYKNIPSPLIDRSAPETTTTQKTSTATSSTTTSPPLSTIWTTNTPKTTIWTTTIPKTTIWTTTTPKTTIWTTTTPKTTIWTTTTPKTTFWTTTTPGPSRTSIPPWVIRSTTTRDLWTTTRRFLPGNNLICLSENGHQKCYSNDFYCVYLEGTYDGAYTKFQGCSLNYQQQFDTYVCTENEFTKGTSDDGTYLLQCCDRNNCNTGKNGNNGNSSRINRTLTLAAIFMFYTVFK